MEILLQSGGYGVNVEVRVRDVVVVRAFKAFFDLLGLCIPAGFAVDTFAVHAYDALLVKAGWTAMLEGFMDTSKFHLLNTSHHNSRDISPFVFCTMLKVGSEQC